MSTAVASCAVDVESSLAQFEQHGYAVFERILNASELERYRTAFDEVIAREAKVGVERGWQNNSYVATYNMAQKHPAFLPLLEQPLFTNWMTRLLGKNFVISQFNAHGMKPNGTEQGLHIDQDESTPGFTAFVQGLFSLDDFTLESGCTRLVPGSHRRPWPWPQSPEQFAALEAQTVRIEAPAGSFISWHGGLWHAGSANHSSRPRRCVSMFCTRPWVRPHCDYTRSLSPDVIGALNETQKRRLGFFATPGWYNYVNDDRTLPKS